MSQLKRQKSQPGTTAVCSSALRKSVQKKNRHGIEIIRRGVVVKWLFPAFIIHAADIRRNYGTRSACRGAVARDGAEAVVKRARNMPSAILKAGGKNANQWLKFLKKNRFNITTPLLGNSPLDDVRVDGKFSSCIMGNRFIGMGMAASEQIIDIHRPFANKASCVITRADYLTS